MQKIKYAGREYEVSEKQTVLDVLLSHGVSIPNSCQSGVCQSCLLKAVRGRPTDKSQKGLKETQIKQRFFMACQCVPENYLEVELASNEAGNFQSTNILEKQALSASVTRLRLQRPADYDYIAGQFVNIKTPEGDIRSYSLASLPDGDDFLEIHVLRHEHGLVSRYLCDALTSGMPIQISEAIGTCFYTNENPDQNILLIGTGTGLAPLYGIARDALRHNHRGKIYLYHGSHFIDNLYYRNELQDLVNMHANFHYAACCSNGQQQKGIVRGRANEVALIHHKDLKGWRVYVCGNPAMVEASKKAAFLAGASLKEIFSDAFFEHKNSDAA